MIMTVIMIMTVLIINDYLMKLKWEKIKPLLVRGRFTVFYLTIWDVHCMIF